MKNLILTLSILFLSFSVFAQNEKTPAKPAAAGKSEALKASAPQTLDALLKTVKAQANQESALWSKRESAFKAQKNKQAAILAKAKSELAVLEAEGRRLSADFDSNEKKLAVIEEELNLLVGTLGEVFGVVRQVSGDFRGQVQTSVISTQFPGREEFLNTLTDKKALPATKELEKLWFELQREMTESGKVVTYKTEVVGEGGKKEMMEITRLGAFNVSEGGKYLNFTPETQTLSYLQRQPASRFRSGLSKIENASAGTIGSVSIDPTRGSLLSMLIEAPTLFERFTQGGIVGYAIVLVLLFGLGLSLERFFFLTKEEKKIKAQMKTETPSEDNALGRIWKSFAKFESMNKDMVELKLDEELIKNSTPFEKRLGTIKLFAAIAPLMGLLGTVTGMIMTFQSITLFGTGNPSIMAGGISQALITTVLGLVCAIPLLLVHNFLNGKAQGILTILEEQSIGLLSKKVSR